MRRRLLAFLAVTAVLIAGLFAFAWQSGAFGDFDGGGDFGGDSGGDYGGYDGGYDGGDDDYGGSSGGGSGEGSVGTVIVGAALVGGLLIWSAVSGKRKGGAKPDGAKPTDPATLKAPGTYQSLDPNFSEAQFKEKLANWFVQFQTCWQEKDIEPVRPCMTEAFYAQMDRQLDAYRKGRRTKMIERVAVLDVKLSGWKQENGRDVMIARLNTRFVTYTVDDDTGELMTGSRTAEKFLDYEWELVRASGRQTAKEDALTVRNCPNCGAAIDINRTAECPYCGSVLTVSDFDWALDAIRAISQRTVGK